MVIKLSERAKTEAYTDSNVELLRTLVWLPMLPPTMPGGIRSWLMESHSMTKRFKKYAKNISITLLSEGMVNEEVILPDERYLLDQALNYRQNTFTTNHIFTKKKRETSRDAEGKTPHKNVASVLTQTAYWLREIILSGDGMPWLTARTLIPRSTLECHQSQICSLGTRPLGHYLFSSESKLTRDFIQVGFDRTSSTRELWGRRSCLRLSDKPLLITELFLPDSPAYIEQN